MSDLKFLGGILIFLFVGVSIGIGIMNLISLCPLWLLIVLGGVIVSGIVFVIIQVVRNACKHPHIPEEKEPRGVEGDFHENNPEERELISDPSDPYYTGNWDGDYNN